MVGVCVICPCRARARPAQRVCAFSVQGVAMWLV